MLAVSVNITGVKEKIDLMKNIQLGLQDFQIGEIINFVCSTVAGEAQAAAPVRTGNLRDSIVYYMNNELSGEVAAMAHYAYAVEYGYTNRGGKKIAGANFFRPPATRGGKLLKDLLLKYTIEVTKGNKPRPPNAAKGSGKGGVKGRKYLYKVQTGAGIRYVYGKDAQTVTSFRPLLKPGPRKSGKAKFRAFRGGAKKR